MCKKIITNAIALTVCISALTACSSIVSSKVENQKLPIVEFNKADSVALNMANQTYLTMPYVFGLRTYKSPLRDFTEEEIKDTKARLDRAINGGAASKVIGTLNILSGNLTGLIDVAGGVSADLSSSKHPASTAHWLIAVDAEKYTSPQEAETAMVSTIKNAVLMLIGDELDLRKVVINENKVGVTTAYLSGNESYGLWYYDPLCKKALPTKGVSSLIDAPQQYLAITEASDVCGGF